MASKTPSSILLLTAFAFATGCGSVAGSPSVPASIPVVVTVGPQAGESCTIILDGRLLSDTNLQAIIAERGRGTPVILRGPRNTPYRCIGGIIYRLQLAGFGNIEVETDA